MHSRRRIRTYGFLLLLALAGGASGQMSLRPQTRHARSVQEPHSSIRVDTQLVLVPVSVCDRTNRPVTGLEKGNFRVFEDKVEQKVTHFAMDDEPLAIGLVFDTSGSMGKKLRKARLAANAFLKTANPEDEFFLVEFDNAPRLVTPLTRNADDIRNRLVRTQPQGRTALFDAIYLAVHEMQKSTSRRKALLVISDGGDNGSRYTAREVHNLVRESDVLVYGIGIFETSGTQSRTAEEISGPDLLSEIAEETGGRHFPVDDLNEMPDIASKIGLELRNRYVLGYAPASPQRDGKYRKLQVKLVPSQGLPPMRAYWRSGYYAPGQ